MHASVICAREPRFLLAGLVRNHQVKLPCLQMATTLGSDHAMSRPMPQTYGSCTLGASSHTMRAAWPISVASCLAKTLIYYPNGLSLYFGGGINRLLP